MGVIPPIGWKWFITKEEVYVASGFLNLTPNTPCSDSMLLGRYNDVGYVPTGPACGKINFSTQLPVPGYLLEEKLDETLNVPWTTPIDDDRETRVPKRKISFPGIRHLCRTGLVRYVPYKSATLAVEKKERKEFYPAPVSAELLRELEEWI
jgi:hypothetical protein